MTQSKMLNYLMGTTSKVEILRVLYESDDAMTGRRIASLAGISPRSCQLSLDSLVENQALFRKAVGRAYSYTINREHRMIWDLLRPVFEAERVLHKEVAQTILKGIRNHKDNVTSLFWHMDRKRKSESVQVLIVTEVKKSVPEKETVKAIEEALTKTFGFAVKGEVVDLAEFAGKVVGSPAALKRFEREWEKIKGAALSELVEVPGKVAAKKPVRKAEETVQE